MTEIQYLAKRNGELREKNYSLREMLRQYRRVAAAMMVVACVIHTVTIAALMASEKKVDALIKELATERIISADYYDGCRKAESELEIANARLDELSTVCGANWYKLVDCTITAYCCEAYPHICGEGHGITKSGMPVQPGVVAVDPEIIPLGSIVIIGGAAYVAADTGAAVKGQAVDIAFATHAEAVAFGVQTQDVWVVEVVDR